MWRLYTIVLIACKRLKENELNMASSTLMVHEEMFPRERFAFRNREDAPTSNENNSVGFMPEKESVGIDKPKNINNLNDGEWDLMTEDLEEMRLLDKNIKSK